MSGQTTEITKEILGVTKASEFDLITNCSDLEAERVLHVWGASVQSTIEKDLDSFGEMESRIYKMRYFRGEVSLLSLHFRVDNPNIDEVVAIRKRTGKTSDEYGCCIETFLLIYGRSLENRQIIGFYIEEDRDLGFNEILLEDNDESSLQKLNDGLALSRELDNLLLKNNNE